MTHLRALITCPLAFEAMKELGPELDAAGVDWNTAEPTAQHLREGELKELIADVDGILCGDDELTASVLQAAPRLRVIAKWGIGLDSIDREEAARRGITVYNTPGVFGAEVAEVALGYMLMLTRHLHQIDAAVRQGKWIKPRGTSLHGKTLGIVGLGSIGVETARRALAFGLRVLGADPDADARRNAERLDVEIVDLARLLAESDILSLHCPLSPATHHLIHSGNLGELKPGVLIVNVSRGKVLAEDALLEGLRSGHIAGAALDVFDEEPLPSGHPLTRLSNVILGSHNASNSVEAVARTSRLAVENLLRGLRDGS